MKRGPKKGWNQKSRDAQKVYLQARASGLSRTESSRSAGVSFKTVTNWDTHTVLAGYPYDFPSMEREAVAQQIRQFGKDTPQMGFEEFRLAVLGRHTFPHQRQWIEWLEEPEVDHILILALPESAKSTTLVDYITYRIYLDQDFRCGYASRTERHSIKAVSRVKNILEQNTLIHALIGNPVPGPGDPHPWTANMFTVRQRRWTPGDDEADATLAAYGAGGQITGSRFDLLIFDDPDDVKIGPADRERIWDVMLQSGETRLGTSGRMVVIGNRQAEEDVYRNILNQHEEDPELWSVNTQEAIVSEPTEEEPNKPLIVAWPEKYGRPREIKSTEPIVPLSEEAYEEHKLRAWRFFDLKRRRLGRRFNLIYQNRPLDDALKDFTRPLVDGALHNMEARFEYPPGSILIAALDPAPSGGAAVLIYALMPPDADGIRRRKVVDFEWGINWRQPGCFQRIVDYGKKYRGIKVWVIDRQGGNKFFTQDPAVEKEIQIVQHSYLHDITTGANKNYGDFAVSSLRNLFIKGKDMEHPTIVLPGASPADKELTSVLRDQLVQYHPDTTYPHDGPMCLWYAERAIFDLQLDRKVIREGSNRAAGWSHGSSGWNLRGGAWSLKPSSPVPPTPGSLVESDKPPEQGRPITPR